MNDGNKIKTIIYVTINYLINFNQGKNMLSLLNVLKEDLQNINLKNNSKCYLNKF